MDRRESGYYSTPTFVSKFISDELLRIKPDGKTVLDPCVGKEELLPFLYEAGKKIHSCDVKDFGVHKCASFERMDFLRFFIERGQKTLDYDYYIANPPYNCHETDYIRAHKEALSRAFPHIGVSNMYAMFMSAMISLARDGAVIGLLTFDSFLTAGFYEPLRKQILEQCAIHDLILCPTDLFRHQKADVRTCILILQKGKHYQQQIRIANRSLNKKLFADLLQSRLLEEVHLNDILLDDGQFVIGCPAEVKRLFEHERLGQLFRCVTGISTGNDKKYVSKNPSQYFTVPFFKNPGSKRFFSEHSGYLPADFLEIEKSVPNFMVRNKDVLFQEGITCSSMGVPFSACYLPAGSTYGVNANIIPAPDDIWWLTAYLNSSLVTYFVRGVLLRTNMITSGYVSRIPVVPLSAAAKQELSNIAQSAHRARPSNSEAKLFVEQIDKIIFSECKLSEQTQSEICEFCSDLIRRT